MNPLLNDYYNREKNAMALYDDTVKAAQGNAAMGANPMAPKLTATPGGIMSLAPLMGAGGATQPWSGDTSHLVGGGFVPFGGFRAKGGPVRPNTAYVVGENGPEVMVPKVPGQIVPSSMNRPYAEMPGGSGSLANRPATPSGRGMTPLRRMQQAERMLVSRGDLVGAAQMARVREWMQPPGLSRAPGSMPQATGPVPRAPAEMAPAGGKLVPGRSAGSMVWQPDVKVSGSMPQATGPVPRAPAEMAPPEPPIQEQANPFALDPLGNPMNPQAFMVPSGFGAMNEFNASRGLPMPPPGLYGPEAAPLVSSMPIPGTDQMQPMVMGQPKGTPVAKTAPAKAAEPWEAPKMYDETIPEVRDAQGNVKSPARTRQYYFVPDPKTGKPMKEYALDANGDGVPDNQQPGWMNWLQGQK